jgi:antitoxin MazE
MKVCKWGNSLAIRLPASIVELLELKEGDDIDIRVAGCRELDAALQASREQLIERLRKFEGRLPPDFKFDREEANAR